MSNGHERAVFVQFPHPGPERRSPTDEMSWNTKAHGRKFLVAPGRYIDREQGAIPADLAFWGEWEPPSRIERRWPTCGRMPRALHRPYWGTPSTHGFRQNTDPWVFGEQMIYSNCKQLTGPARHPTALQRLPRGSIICFGSTIDGRFCIDTVFVVASCMRWIPSVSVASDLGDAFATCTSDAVATIQRDAHRSLVTYRGATIEQPVEGMFSFVPARLAELDDPRFARPAVDSPFINPSSRQSTKGSNHLLPVSTLREAWESIRDQVLVADLVLGVTLQTPEREDGPIIVSPVSAETCSGTQDGACSE